MFIQKKRNNILIVYNFFCLLFPNKYNELRWSTPKKKAHTTHKMSIFNKVFFYLLNRSQTKSIFVYASKKRRKMEWKRHSKSDGVTRWNRWVILKWVFTLFMCQTRQFLFCSFFFFKCNVKINKDHHIICGVLIH